MPNMTGRPGYRTMEMNGGSSAPYLACTPCVPLFCTLFNRSGNRVFFSRLPGAGGADVHCAVEPSRGHIRCRKKNPHYCFQESKGYVFFLPPLFCQRVPAFWTQNLGKNRLISANLGKNGVPNRPYSATKSLVYCLALRKLPYPI